MAETRQAGRLLWWLAAASLLLHLLLIGLSVIRKRPEADFSPSPSYDLVFEGSPQAAAEHVLPPSKPADTPAPPDAPIGPPAPTPDAMPSPDGTAEPQAEPATAPPTPAPAAPSAPAPAPPPSPPPATASMPQTAPSPPQETAPAPPAAAAPPPIPLSTTEPAPLAAFPAPAPEPPVATQARPPEPEVNLRPPPEAPPAPQASRDFQMPAPPPPLPPLPAPRPRRPAPRAAFGTLAQPMDLSFAPRPAARSMAIARGLDLSVPLSAQRAALTGPYAAIRAAKASEDWNRSLLQYWLQHRYYPQEAAQAGESGTVTIELTVARSGQVESVRVLSPSGSQWLDMAAVGTFRGAKLRPFTEEMPEDRLTFPVPITYYLIQR